MINKGYLERIIDWAIWRTERDKEIKENSRSQMGWINELISASSEAETPLAWIRWAGIATVSAVIAPNTYMNRGGIYKLSPNVFVMLIGESGLGKGFPINVSKKLVRLVDSTRVIAGRNTIQSILKELGNSFSDPKNGGAPKFPDSRGYIISGEFSTLLQKDEAALPTITELYDTHYMDEWKNSTKNSGIDELKGVNITLFGASTPEHFSAAVPEENINGGFVGRILTVFQEKRSRINPLDDTDAENNFPFDQLAQYLKDISRLKGAFQWRDEKARSLWKDWYTEIRTKSEKIKDPTGAINRLTDNVLKIAMCLSVAEKPELYVTREALSDAIDECQELTIDSKKLTEGKGTSQLAEATKIVLYAVYKNEGHRISRSKLIQEHYGYFDTYELGKIMTHLENAGLIEVVHVGGGKQELVSTPALIRLVTKKITEE